jgi:lipopolysaccharide assembly protein A
MRWFHIILIALFALAILVFALQNFQSVTIAYLGFSVSAPLALLAALAYVLGMATGGSLLALVRWSIEGSKRRDA